MPPMEARGAILIAGLLLLATDAPASSDVFRCTAPGGRITYQEIPCPNDNAERVIDVPSHFPEIDRAARDRLFQREAALDARQLKREELDAALRIAREERLGRDAEVRQAAMVDAAPLYLIGQPLRPLRPFPLRHHLRPHERPL